MAHSQIPSGSQMTTTTYPSHASSQGIEPPYTFPWGKHKGKQIEEIPLEYLRWLQTSSNAYNINLTMQRVVEEYVAATLHYPSSQPLSSTLPAAQPGSSQQRQPLGPLSSNVNRSQVPYVLHFGKHKGQLLANVPSDYIAWLRQSDMIKEREQLAEAMRNYDAGHHLPTEYKLCFGKWKGYTLAEVAPSYLTNLHDSDAAKENGDLRAALAEHKQANALKQRLTQKSGSTKKPFHCPSEVTTDYRRYYYNGDRKGGQMWICCNDALKYFGADRNAMRAAGLRSFTRGQRF
ncbi:putative quorum-sensing-regulated virulence factor [Septoria linicola]|nr:putative quorum-sensing-regulated virulence factor [Septoria linicola]